MPGIPELPLTTYLLHGLTRFDVAEIRSLEPLYFEVGRGGRGVLVSFSPPGNAERIGRKLPGDNRDVVSGWLDQTEAERLAAEYRRAPPSPEVQAAALGEWKEIYERRVRLDHELKALAAKRAEVMDELQEVRTLEIDASKNVLRTHGKTVVSVDGELWELRNSRGGLLLYRAKGRDVEAK